jgi:hypothetical protein
MIVKEDGPEGRQKFVGRKATSQNKRRIKNEIRNIINTALNQAIMERQHKNDDGFAAYLNQKRHYFANHLENAILRDRSRRPEDGLDVTRAVGLLLLHVRGDWAFGLSPA